MTRLNIRRARACFAIWFCTNVSWASYDFEHGLPARGVLMSNDALPAGWGQGPVSFEKNEFRLTSLAPWSIFQTSLNPKGEEP